MKDTDDTMSRDNLLSRRTTLKVGAGGLAAMAAGVSTGTAKEFYDGGTFDPKKAIKAYLELMERFGYPISDALRTDQLWVCDFLQADFAKIGMGGIFWVNATGTYGKAGEAKYKGDFKDQKFGYLGHEIFLLPGQALPEHNHLGGPEEIGPKMESWHVRYGEVEYFGEYKGAGDEMLISDMPEKDRPWGYGEDWFKSKYVAKRTAQSGQLYSLEDPESWHFQRAGAEGAIVSEYATYHNPVQFCKPGMEFDSTKA